MQDAVGRVVLNVQPVKIVFGYGRRAAKWAGSKVHCALIHVIEAGETLRNGVHGTARAAWRPQKEVMSGLGINPIDRTSKYACRV